MFKKPLNTILAGYYLALSIGLTVSAHYCLGTISSISIATEAEYCACGEEEAMPCCTTESIVVSLEDDQTFTKSIQSQEVMWTSTEPFQSNTQCFNWDVSDCRTKFENRGPPLTSGKDIRLKIHALIFYA